MIGELMVEELYAPTEKISLSKILPSNKPPKSKSYAVIDQKTGDILHFCSAEYKLHLNQDVYKPLEKLFKKYKIKFYTVVRILSRTKFYVDYILDINKFKNKKLPELLPCISVWNSYDGSVKNQVNFGYYRRETEIKIPSPTMHSIDCGSIQCVEHLEDFIKNGKKDFEIFSQLNQISVTTELINVLGKKLKLSLEIKKKALANLGEELKKEFKLSLFIVYLAINRAIVTCNEKEAPEFKYKRKKALMLEVVKSL